MKYMNIFNMKVKVKLTWFSN